MGVVLPTRAPPVADGFVGHHDAAFAQELFHGLWRKLPPDYQRCVSCSDFWRAFQCLPAATHHLVGKETGETAHIERRNNTLRQRLSRLVHKTLSFAKKEDMLNLHFKLFAYCSNVDGRLT
jgi:insertion element IS1 protein InsB